MTDAARPVTSKSSVAQWLEHPEGGPLLRELLAQAGFDEKVLAPVRQLSLERLAELSQGQLEPGVIEDMVRRANGGVIPAEAASEAGQWRERIVPGRFEGQTVIVTGAGSGIGQAVASRIAREGGRVIAADISAAGLDKLAAGLDGTDLVTVVADVTKPGDISQVLVAAGSAIDGLANVAGVTDDFSPIHEVSDEVWYRVFSINVHGTFLLTRAVIPVMLAAGRGSIVNVASEAAFRGSASGVAYTASKHAVVGMTRSSAFMYEPHGIRVNAVAPGGVATGMRPADNPSEFGTQRTMDFLALIPPIATASQIAASITFLLSDDGVNISGAVLPADGGWSVH